MKNPVILFSVLILSFSQVIGQQMPDPSVKIEAMKKLNILTGSWEGSGWASAPDGSRHEFTQSEIIEEKLDGVALLVQGLGKDKDSGNVIHNALAIITYDENDSSYVFQSHLNTGQSTTAKGYFENDSFIWGFEVPGGQIRYTINIQDNKWNEIGEFSRDGSQFYKFIEMNLQKIDE